MSKYVLEVPPWMIDQLRRDKERKQQEEEDARPRVYIDPPEYNPEEDTDEPERSDSRLYR